MSLLGSDLGWLNIGKYLLFPLFFILRELLLRFTFELIIAGGFAAFFDPKRFCCFRSDPFMFVNRSSDGVLHGRADGLTSVTLDISTLDRDELVSIAETLKFCVVAHLASCAWKHVGNTSNVHQIDGPESSNH